MADRNTTAAFNEVKGCIVRCKIIYFNGQVATIGPKEDRGRHGLLRTFTLTDSKRVVLSSPLWTKAEKEKRAVAEPALLSTNCYCQCFSPETLPHFLQWEDERRLKRALEVLKCVRQLQWGQCERDGRGFTATRGPDMLCVLTMFDSNIFVFPSLKKKQVPGGSQKRFTVLL